jgi:CPA2 family monovalent cation:H+ antiporter-2
MPHHDELLLTLSGCLGVALILGYITQRLGLSPIVGYLLAGIVVGPNTPGFTADPNLAKELAEVGVILLMFGVGLHFHIEELLSVRRIAIPGALGQSLAATLLGVLAGWLLGWTTQMGIVFGLAISVASTVVLTRVLTDNRQMHTPTGHIAVGWLVVEDILTVVVLVLFPTLFGKEEGGLPEVAGAIGLAGLKIGVLVAAVFILGGRAIPWLLKLVAQTRSRELFTLTVLVVALGIALGSAKLFDVSMELGAFLAGMVVGRSEFSSRAASEALPMRDAFAVLFFVSVGMMFDPKLLTSSPGAILLTLGIVMVGKPLSAFVIIIWRGYPLRVALGVAIALGQIGEFTFILASMAASYGLMPKEAGNTLVVAAIISISLNPLLYRAIDPFERWITGRPRLNRWLSNRGGRVETVPVPIPEESTGFRAVVVGYGPVGQTLCRLLRENEIEPTVIELNFDTAQRLMREGLPAVYGDASQPETLKAAGIEGARGIILSAVGLPNAQEIIRRAKELNPELRVLVRCGYLREIDSLHRAGAERVFSGEGEVALAMTESLMRSLGATDEQIDRERARVRSELFVERQA